MLRILPLHHTDLLSMEPQPEQSVWFASDMTGQTARYLAENPLTRCIKNDADVVLLCCGIIPLHENLAHAWTILSVHASPHMFGLVKAMRKIMEEAPQRRLEMNVRSGFTRAHKWARLLGFTCEGIMRCYAQNGEDHHLYARIRR